MQTDSEGKVYDGMANVLIPHKVGGEFHLSYRNIPGGLFADPKGSEIESHLRLDHITVDQEVKSDKLTVGGIVFMDESRLRGNAYFRELRAEHINARESEFESGWFNNMHTKKYASFMGTHFSGSVFVDNANAGTHLDFEDARIGDILRLSGSSIGHTLGLNGVRAGDLFASDTKVGGLLDCRDLESACLYMENTTCRSALFQNAQVGITWVSKEERDRAALFVDTFIGAELALFGKNPYDVVDKNIDNYEGHVSMDGFVAKEDVSLSIKTHPAIIQQFAEEKAKAGAIKLYSDNSSLLPEHSMREVTPEFLREFLAMPQEERDYLFSEAYVYGFGNTSMEE